MGILFSVCQNPSRGGRNGGSNAKRQYDAPVGCRPAVSVGGTPPHASGRKRAVLIGINYEGTKAALRGCHNDVQQMSHLLQAQYGFPSDSTRILTDANGPASSKPTRANILASARWLVEGVQPGDCLFFHFSGHGAQQEDPRGAEEDCMDETILPVDFQAAGQIIDDELFEVLCANLPSGAKLTAVMDCCHSGTGLDLPCNYDLHMRSWVEDDNPCHSEGDVQLFSGCQDDQTSADVGTIYQAASGAMTTAFCDTLKSNPLPTYPQLLDGLHQHLSQRGHTQRPQLTSSQKFSLNRGFEICGGFCMNENPTIGRHFNKRKHPKSQWLSSGDPLGDMLITDMVVDDCLFSGGLFGMGYGDSYGYGGGYDSYGGDGYHQDGDGGGLFGGDGDGDGGMFGGDGD